MSFRTHLFATSLFLLTLPAPARPDAPAVTGPAETVFDWAEDRCARWDIPDAPARAWRGTDGDIRLISGAEESRLSIGPDLDRLSRVCDVVHAGREDDDPAAYDDRSWLASPYIAADGELIALAHVEFHGHERPELCAAGSYSACWWNAIVELRATDGGMGFERPSGAGDLVAALPYRYAGDQAQRTGYFNPSNVIARDGYLHAFIFAEAAGAQQRGACLIRRPVAGGAADWRAWDGRDFTIRFVDSYLEAPENPAAHVCAPLPGISSTISAVVEDEFSGSFLAVTPATLRDAEGILRSGIWWTVSGDLLDWSRPRLLLELPLLWRRDCAAGAAYAYPSLLDPDSTSANFDTVDADFFLYLVRIALDADCRAGPSRDLIRLPVRWAAARVPGAGLPEIGAPARMPEVSSPAPAQEENAP